MQVKRFIRNTAILLTPFLLMIIVNEIIRPTIKEEPYLKSGITAINSDERISDNCTWICHHETGYCKENHVKHLIPYYRYTDPLYFGIINMLQSTKKYEAANIFFLVILVPLLIWIFLIKSLNTQGKIRALK